MKVFEVSRPKSNFTAHAFVLACTTGSWLFSIYKSKQQEPPTLTAIKMVQVNHIASNPGVASTRTL